MEGLKFVNTTEIRIGVEIVKDLVSASTTLEKLFAKSVEANPYANIIGKDQIARNAVVVQYANTTDYDQGARNVVVAQYVNTKK